MKKKFISIASILATVFLTACSDFLETPPSVDYGEDEVFATRVGVEKLLTTLTAVFICETTRCEWQTSF